jgi:Integral membrane protein possibly involved in chromosome condensation
MIGFWVALAGGLGAVVRFIVDAQFGHWAPRGRLLLGTAVINITGSFALGLVVGVWTFHGGDPQLRQLIGTGFLGGYTTFSTAAVEAVRLGRAQRWLAFGVHTVAMLALSVAGAALGFWLGAL